MINEESLKEKYFQHFDSTDIINKTSKNLKTAYFTLQGPQEFPRIAILKELYGVRKEYINEANFLKTWSNLHPNIVKYYYDTVFDGRFRIFMEHCECGSLSKLIKERKDTNKPWTDLELINHFITIADVIKTLHDHDYIHRDMKPDNIFVKDYEILKIGDFGDSREIRIGETEYTAKGTKIYMSPRYWKFTESLPVRKDGKRKTNINRLKEEEVWSVGKTFYEMAALDIYAEFPDLEERYMERVEFFMSKKPERLANLLKLMLKDNYTERPSITDVLTELINIKNEVENPPLILTASSKAETILQVDGMSFLNSATREISETNKYSINDLVEISNYNVSEGFFSPPSSAFQEFQRSTQGSTGSNYECECECDIEYEQDYLLGYISTSRIIECNPQKIRCMNCLRQFPTKYMIA